MTLRVNRTEISEERIREEMQYHPASSSLEARRLACEALAVRCLLLEEADRVGITAADRIGDASGKLIEAPEEARIRVLMENQVSVPAPTEEQCRAYYQENGHRFRSPDLLRASHILFGADLKNECAMARAKARAEEALLRLAEAPELFPSLARELSDCSSGQHGGDLGQVTRGSTIPELETFLFALEPGQICPVPIRTRYGYHIARLDHRLDGRQLPFEAVRSRIAAYLQERSWREAVRDYIAGLIAKADIKDQPPLDIPDRGRNGIGCGCASSTGAGL